jgi:ATP-binding cassette subfamily B protein
MDRKTEQFVINLLNKLKNELSVIFISHRLHSLKHLADRIYIIEGNSISHYGSHEQLLESDNFYSQFWEGLYQNVS